MKLTVLELAIIVDTLNGSTSIKGGDLFRYTEEARKLTMNHLIDIMRQAVVEIDKKEE